MQVLGCIGYSSTDNFDVVWFLRLELAIGSARIADRA